MQNMLNNMTNYITWYVPLHSFTHRTKPICTICKICKIICTICHHMSNMKPLSYICTICTPHFADVASEVRTQQDPASPYLMTMIWDTSIFLVLKYQMLIIFPKEARDFFLLDFRPSPNQFFLSRLRISMVQPDFFIAGC